MLTACLSMQAVEGAALVGALLQLCHVEAAAGGDSGALC
jgi:hypothetical protein